MSRQRSHKGKVTICLVNTYDKLKWHDIHSRNIARAAPLCFYTGFELCLFDFPFKDDFKEFLLKEVKENTTIGDGGKYIEELINHENLLSLMIQKSKVFSYQQLLNQKNPVTLILLQKIL